MGAGPPSCRGAAPAGRIWPAGFSGARDGVGEARCGDRRQRPKNPPEWAVIPSPRLRRGLSRPAGGCAKAVHNTRHIRWAEPGSGGAWVAHVPRTVLSCSTRNFPSRACPS